MARPRARLRRGGQGAKGPERLQAPAGPAHGNPQRTQPGGPSGSRPSAPKKYTFLSGSQAKRSLDLHQKVGGAGGGFDLAGKLAAQGKGEQAMRAAARVSAIRKARASGDRKAYVTAVRENRQARLDYNQGALGLNRGPGKKLNALVASKKLTRKRLKGANPRTQVGTL